MLTKSPILITIIISLMIGSLTPSISREKGSIYASPDVNTTLGEIIFIRDENIWTVNPDGSNLSQLTSAGGYSEPIWSRDGTLIAFVHRFIAADNQKEAYEIRILNTQTNEQTVVVPAEKTPFILLDNYYQYYNPRWSADGKSIYYIAWDYRAQGDFVHKMDIITGGKDVNFTSFHARSIDVSPTDGKIVFYDYFNAIPNGDTINLINPDGSQPRVLIPLVDGIYNRWPRFSPDGLDIAFVRSGWPDEFINIEVLNLKSLERTKYPVDNFPVNNDLFWAPDRSRIIYDTDGLLRFLDLSTGNITGFVNGTDPSWNWVVTSAYSISGLVTDDRNNPIWGASISASGGYSATTDSHGVYVLRNLPEGSYTLTPTKKNYNFSPASRSISIPPNKTGVNFTGEHVLADGVIDFITHSRQKINHISSLSGDVSTVGDYFLDKLEADEVKLVVNIGMNTISLAGVDWGKVGLGLNHIATPGYKAALHASWRGWVDDRVAKHWYKPLYDTIHNERKILFDDVAWSGLEYYSGEALKGPIKDWLIEILIPGPSLPIRDNFGQPAADLGAGYRAELLREQNAFLNNLGILDLTPDDIALYQQDLLARQQAHDLLKAQLQSHRDLLWDSYEDAKADEASWWKFWGGFLFKYGVIFGATLIWDGPGYAVASAGFAVYDLIHDAINDTQALTQDQKIVDQSLRFLEGRVSTAYSQIGLNTVNALNMMRAGESPQIAKGTIGAIAEQSFGHYRLWPDLFWAEDKSQAEFPITNNKGFLTQFLTSAAYPHSGFWIGTEQLWIEGESPQVDGLGEDSVTLVFKDFDYGVSPDEGKSINLLILGATETGIYPVKNTQFTWNPTRVETLTGEPALQPAGFTPEEIAASPILPFPLTILVTVLPETTDYQLIISVLNSFDLAVEATVTQAIPAGFTILDPDGGAQTGSVLTWTASLEPGESIELRPVLRWDGAVGEETILPGAELAFIDPDTDLGDTYTAPDETVTAAWPLELSADIPPDWQKDSVVDVPVTLSNISDNAVAQGTFTGKLTTIAGEVIWSSSTPIEIAAQGEKTITLTIDVSTRDDFVVFSGEVEISGIRKEMLMEVIPLEGSELYIPIVQK